MSELIKLSGRQSAQQHGCRALSDEVRGGVVLVQVSEDGSQSLAPTQLLQRLWILGLHVDREVSIRGKESHLSFRVATICAMRISFDEFPDRKAIGGFCR